jgi:hypothetical protein
MRILVVFIVFLLSTSVSQAQTNAYLADLATLKSILQKTPSYKAQVKGEKRSLYNALYDRLVSDSIHTPTNYGYFYNLAQLLFPLRDNHLGFYQVPNYSNFKDKESISRYVETKAFLEYPSYTINIDSLKEALGKKPADSIEGIYHYDTFYDVGLFKKSNNEYVGVVVNSTINLWKNGQIAIHLYQYGPNMYKAIYGHPLTKIFLLQTSEKYRDGSLVNSFFYSSYSQQKYSKQPQSIDYVNLAKGAPKFELKTIDNDVQYLLIRSFQTNNATRQKSTAFYDSIKNALTAKNLVVDLRNNEGGSKKEAEKYYKLLKKYTKKGHLYVLLNNETISQAEILTLRLKKLPHTTTVGQTTKGMLSYGSNYGKRQKLSNGQFEIYITDMKGKPSHLQYEDYGIMPDISLNSQSDWLGQVVDIVNKK